MTSLTLHPRRLATETARGGSPLELLPLCLVLAYAAMALLPVGDPDVWWHLRTGELVLEEGFTRTDPWSWTSTEPWLLHEWLSEVVMYLAYLAAGYHGVIVLRAVMLALISWLVLRSCRRQAGPAVSAAVGVLALTAIYPASGERPQLASFALLALMLPRLRRAIDRREPPWELVPVTYLWANLHLLWVSALVLYAAMAFGLLLDLGLSEWRRAAPFGLVGAVSGLVTMLTPNGPTLLLMPLKAVGSPGFLPTEFLPPKVSDPFTACALGLLFVVLVGWARRGRPAPMSEICFVLAATFVGLTYVRTVPILAIAVAPLAARTIRDWSRHPVQRPTVRRVDRAIAGCLICLTLVLAAMWLPQVPGVKAGAPYSATRFLNDLPGRARVINEYEFGGWLLWRGRDVSPGIDGRAETKTVEYLNAYVATLNMQGDWRTFVEEANADAAWLRREAPLVEGLRTLGWRTVHRDDFSLVLVPPVQDPH